MTSDKISSIERVRQHADRLGLKIEVLELPQSTRTAAEAAIACKCEVAQIIKSMIFERCDDNALVLVLVSGAHNADMSRLAEYFGCNLRRADPGKIRQQTGFAIGGVAPIGHLIDIPVYADETLMQYDKVWAAAGKPNAVFCVNPKTLTQAIGAHRIKV